MTEGEAIHGILQLMPLIIISGLAFWRFHPVLFMMNAGVSIVTAGYLADIINGGETTNLTITYSLALIIYGFANIGFAFLYMFRPAGVRE